MAEESTLTRSDVEAIITSAIARHGNEKAAIGALAKQNFKLRRTRDELQTRVTELEGKAPKEGATVLSGDDVKEWEAFKALGKKASEVASAITKGEEATARLAGLEWEQGARKAASAAGITNADAFLLLPGVRDLTFEVRTEKEDGKDVERVLYKGKEGEAKTLSREAIEGRADWKPLAPALFAEAAEENGRSAQQQTQGIPFSRQRSERKGGETKKSDEDYRKAVISTTNYGL